MKQAHYWRQVVLLLLLTSLFLPASAGANTGADTGSAAPVSPAGLQAAPRSIYLPLIFGPPPTSWRMGFGSWGTDIVRYPQVTSLKAGWYVNWTTQVRPQRPGFIEYVQMIRIHQKLTCPLWSTNAHNRTICPYAQPYDYVTLQTRDEIAAAVRANPQSLWLIGNEMDRRDWPGGGQDEMLPEVYARAYHDMYQLVKGIDPKARVAIGGVIQPTPLRLQYLTQVWNTYKALYGKNMPVDVWNVHNFILQEKMNDYGAGIPPGIQASEGVSYPDDELSHINRQIFDQQIRAFRAWMKARGEQNKPLIISEYGVLYSHVAQINTAAAVQDFMVWTFDYFLTTRDCSLGYAADDCRLVQRWAWYSLDDPATEFNRFGPLFNFDTLQISSTGVRYRDYSLSKLKQLGWAAWW
jgi:hypothetical protein